MKKNLISVVILALVFANFCFDSTFDVFGITGDKKSKYADRKSVFRN